MIITGGAGNTIFAFGYGTGNNLITDFGSRYFVATLDEAQQVPPTGSTGTGSGTVVLNRDKTSAAVHLEVTGLSTPAGMGHIHNGAAGVNGPIIFELSPPAGTSFSIDRVWTTAADLGSHVANLIGGKLYFNVHTTNFSGGEIRGQITAAPGDTGADRIDLRAINIGSFATLQAITVDVGAGDSIITVLKNGVGASLRLKGVSESELKAGDFIFAGSVAQSINGTIGADTLFGAGGNDTMRGGRGNDSIFGEAGKDRLDGGVGNDKLFGGDSNDTLIGNVGVDVLTGGLGKDIMSAGVEADDFVFNAPLESKAGSGRDIIKDFKHGVDDIDLRAIDANGTAAGNGKFKFLAKEDADFTGVKGQLRWFQIDSTKNSLDKTIIEGDLNGDKRADFQIELTGLKVLTAGDFFL